MQRHRYVCSPIVERIKIRTATIRRTFLGSLGRSFMICVFFFIQNLHYPLFSLFALGFRAGL